MHRLPKGFDGAGSLARVVTAHTATAQADDHDGADLTNLIQKGGKGPFSPPVRGLVHLARERRPREGRGGRGGGAVPPAVADPAARGLLVGGGQLLPPGLLRRRPGPDPRRETRSVGELAEMERRFLRPLPQERFELAELAQPRVDEKSPGNLSTTLRWFLDAITHPPPSSPGAC